MARGLSVLRKAGTLGGILAAAMWTGCGSSKPKGTAGGGSGTGGVAPGTGGMIASGGSSGASNGGAGMGGIGAAGAGGNATKGAGGVGAGGTATGGTGAGGVTAGGAGGTSTDGSRTGGSGGSGGADAALNADLADAGPLPAALSSGTTASLSFGSVALGSSSAERSFTITNTGQTASSTITLSADNGEFAIQNGAAGGCVSGATTLAAGAFCTVSIVFTPAGSGTRTGTITFSAASGGKGIVATTGTGGTSTVSGTLALLAGSPSGIGSADGTGAAAHFYSPSAVAVDGVGNIYVADTSNNTIRKVTPAGAVSTLAGAPGAPGSADGTGATARFYGPTGVAADGAGNVFVADTGNHTIRKITPPGVVTTVAGTAGSYGIEDGTGAAASFWSPASVTVDGAGNLFVAEPHDIIRKITPAGDVTTLAGKVGSTGSADGTGAAASFNNPTGVAADGTGNLFVADYQNCTIRKITPAGAVTTLAGTPGLSGSADGTGAAASFKNPTGVAVDGLGNVFVADSSNHTIRKITPAGAVTTLAGTPGSTGSGDGTGAAARFQFPTGVAVDGAGNVFVADAGNHNIRKITPGGTVTTLAGAWGLSGSADGTGAAASFSNPNGVAVDGARNVFVADSGNRTIRKITPAGAVTTLAGTPGLSGSADGTGAAASFSNPYGMAADGAGNVFVADAISHNIRRITPAGAVTTLDGMHLSGDDPHGLGVQPNPYGVAVDGAGNVFVADFLKHTILKTTPGGAVTTFAGTPGLSGSADGTGAAASFSAPIGLAADGAGNVFVADNNNSTIRKITPAGAVTTLAGTPGLLGSADGTGAAARFNRPTGVAVDGAGNVFVVDALNNSIRKITPAGVVTTVVGASKTAGNVPGPLPASLREPHGVAVDPSTGNLYITVDHAVMVATW
jgi:sugar lactone lactonase YvrE